MIVPETVPLVKVCRAMFRAGGVASWEYGVLGPDGNPAGATLHSEWTGANPGPASATQGFEISFDASSRIFACRLGSPGNTPSDYTVPTGTLDDEDQLDHLVLIVHLSSYPGSVTLLDGAELTIAGDSPESLDSLSQTTFGDTTRTLPRYLARGFTLTGQIEFAWDETKPTQSRYWIQIGPNG